MSYICHYEFCEHKEEPIRDTEGVHCSKCGVKKVFHKNCFEKHNNEKHSGKAVSKPTKGVKTFGAVLKRK